MRYKNNSGGILLVPSENGKGGSIEVPKDAYFDGSSLYAKYSAVGLERVFAGTPVVGTPSNSSTSSNVIPSADPLVFTIGKRLIMNGMAATASDAAIVASGSVVTAGTKYTAFGQIRWSVGGTEFSVYFSVTGNGTHGSGATFAFTTPSGSPSTKPTVTGSSVDVRNGAFSVQFDSGAADANSVRVDAQYDYEFSGESLYYGAVGRSVTNFPNMRTRTIYVAASDVSGDAANYVNGSAGQVKQVRSIPKGSQVGDPIKVTNYRYRDSANATKATNEDQADDVATIEDLA